MGLHARSWQLRQCVRIAGKGCDRCSEEKRALVVRGSEARPVPQRKDELLLGKMCPNALCKLECIHSLEFQLNLNQSRRCQTLGCDGQLLKKKTTWQASPPGPGILTGPLQVEYLTRTAPAMLAGSCICQPPFLRPHHLPTESFWVPPRVWAFPSQQPLQASG